MSQRADRLVGRAEELDLLGQALEVVDGGRSAAIGLVGEAGIGKTRLLAALVERADSQGRLVLSGSASELEQDLPFSVFVDALDEYVRGLDPETLAGLDEDVRNELAHVFPSLAALASKRHVALQHERYRTHRAVRGLLEHLAQRRPLVLVLDDVHWADPASVELLGALLRRPPTAPVLVALGLRPRPIPERLAAALARAQRTGGLTRIELGALTLPEARDLLGDAIDGHRAAALYEESGGNPFYLEQLARSLDRVAGPHDAPEAPLAGIDVPSGVAASLSEEVALLSERGRLVLEGAAVAGDPFEPELAAAAAATSEEDAVSALDELLELDLVRTTEVPRRFSFRHPLVRRAVYEGTAAGWRLGAHERCAAALEERGATAPERAHHVERSARTGDLEAVAVLREAGDASARLAPASAAHWYAQALRLLPPAAPAEMRIDLLVSRARALTASGHFAESHDVLLEAVEAAPPGADELRARLARDCAGVESLLGRQQEAAARLTAALESLSDRSSLEAVSLQAELAVNAVWRARYEEMHDWADGAVRAARSLGDPALIAASLAVRAFGGSMTGSAEQAAADHAEAAELVDSLSDDELATHIEAAAWLAGLELYLGRYLQGELHAARGLAVARATGQGELVLVLVQTLGAVWRMRGKLAEAGELLDGGIEASRLLGNTHALVWNLNGRSATALHAGDIELALAAAEESVELTRDEPGSFHAAEAAAVLASALLETQQADRAVALLLDSAGGEELELIAGGARASFLELLTRCWLALDRPAEARRVAARAEDWAAAMRLPMPAAWAGRASAAVRLQAGDAASAVERALASAAAAEESGAPIEAALARALAGRALAAAGERDRAVEELQSAAAELEAHGAVRHRSAVERELRRLGRSIHRRTHPGDAQGTGIETLTERELQVARLVVDRRTNSEIAAELYLSQKTVETHLRNIFRKIGVSSRVELARAVERADRAAEQSS